MPSACILSRAVPRLLVVFPLRPSPRARRRVDVVAGEALVGVFAAAFEGFLGRAAGNQAVAAVADQVVAARPAAGPRGPRSSSPA